MSRSYSFQAVDGQTVIAITGEINAAHRFMLAYSAVPTTGTISVEYQELGDSTWIPVNGATNIDMSLGNHGFDLEAPVGFIRLTITGATGGGESLLWISSAVFPSGSFSGTRALITQPYSEVNIKLGIQFELPLLIPSIATGTSYYIAAEVGDKPIIIKNRAIDVNGGMEYRPWAGATYTRGTLIDRVQNLNKTSATVNTTKFYNVVGTPTLPAGGDFDIVKSAIDTGNNRNIGQFPAGAERIVPANSKILIEFKNTQAQAIWVVFKTTWAETNTDLQPNEPI